MSIVSLRLVRASVSPQGIWTVVQVGESSCVLGLGLQTGLGWGKETRRQKMFFLLHFSSFIIIFFNL